MAIARERGFGGGSLATRFGHWHRLCLGKRRVCIRQRLPPSGALADSGAHKVNFLDLPTVATCDGPIGDTPDASFAVIEATGNGRITADVSLTNGQPNALYSVELVQSGCSSFSVTTVTTNGQGNANAPLSAQQVSSDASVFVDEISPRPQRGFPANPRGDARPVIRDKDMAAAASLRPQPPRRPFSLPCVAARGQSLGPASSDDCS